MSTVKMSIDDFVQMVNAGKIRITKSVVTELRKKIKADVKPKIQWRWHGKSCFIEINDAMVKQSLKTILKQHQWQIEFS